MEDSSSPHTSFKIITTMNALLGLELGYYRILTSSTIKYLSFLSPNLSPPEGFVPPPIGAEYPLHHLIPDYRGEKLRFNTVPEGDWNLGHLTLDPTGKLILDYVETKQLDCISNKWCQYSIDWLDIGEMNASDGALQCQNLMFSFLSRNHFGVESVVVHYEWYPETLYGPIRETEIYGLIQGKGIAPNFVAHFTENHKRVIGYLTEYIPGRHATIEDLDICRQVLLKLHELGIAHGSLSYRCFLIHENRALLHGFGGSKRTNDRAVLKAEMDSLEDILQR